MRTETYQPTQDVRGLPVWVRAPRRGVEFYSGFSRSKLYQLAAEKKIESASIREGNQQKGTRLFRLASLLNYIEGHAK